MPFVAVVDGIADVLTCVGELLGGRRGWLRAVEQLGQLGAAVLQVDEFGAQVVDSGAALGVGQGAGFEREQIAFDRMFGLGDVSVDDLEFAFVLGAVGLAAVGGVVGDSVEQVMSAVERQDAVECGGVRRRTPRRR